MEILPQNNLSTTGVGFWPGYTLPLCVSINGNIPLEAGFGERYRMVLIEEGGGVFKEGGRLIPFSAPSVFCWNEKENPELDSGGSVRYSTLCFHPSALNIKFDFRKVWGEGAASLNATDIQDLYWLGPFIRRDKQFTGKIPIGPLSAKKLFVIFSQMDHELKNQSESWPCRSRSYMIESLFLLNRIMEDPSFQDDVFLEEQPDDIRKILVYVHTHYSEKITINTLARDFHTNRTTLQERFSSVTGKTVMKYLSELRLQLASLLLRETLVSIGEIAERVGHNDLTHFGRSFKQAMQMSPQEYREQNCWMLRV